MQIQKLELEGLLLIHLKSFQDDRGFFVERYNESRFRENGLPTHFVQDNFSRSGQGVLRGLHFQTKPGQGKLVSCTRGEILDVVVDLRKNSATFGKYFSIRLSGDETKTLWVPSGFAHGFCATSPDGADVLYKVDHPYNPSTEACLRWNCQELNIPWPVENPILSPKDGIGMSFSEAAAFYMAKELE